MRKRPADPNPEAAGAAGTAAVAPPAKEQDKAADQAAERVVREVDAGRFRGREYVRSDWVVTAFEHTTPEDLLKPEYWKQVSSQLKPRDRVEAWANDGTWMADYVVLEAGRSWARLYLLGVAHFTSGDMAQTYADVMSPYEITHRGPHSKWSVIRKSDRQVVSEGHETARAAGEWLGEHMKAIHK